MRKFSVPAAPTLAVISIVALQEAAHAQGQLMPPVSPGSIQVTGAGSSFDSVL